MLQHSIVPGNFSGLANLLFNYKDKMVMYFQHTGNNLGYSYKVVNSVNVINMM